MGSNERRGKKGRGSGARGPYKAKHFAEAVLVELAGLLGHEVLHNLLRRQLALEGGQHSAHPTHTLPRALFKRHAKWKGFEVHESFSQHGVVTGLFLLSMFEICDEIDAASK